MSLFVQLPNKGLEFHHRVASFESSDTGGDQFAAGRSYTTGCGATVSAPAHRMSEADQEPGGLRCTRAGCFKTATVKED